MSEVTVYDIRQNCILPAKHPLTERSYTISLVSSDGTNDGTNDDTGFLQGRTLSSIAVSAQNGITVDSSSNTTTYFTIQFSGGTAGNSYKVNILCTLSTTLKENITVILPVEYAKDSLND